MPHATSRLPARIVSGGQTGADRAAWDAAIGLGIPYGGWVPADAGDERGPIPDRYCGYTRALDSHPDTRTRLNVRDSDGTLVLSHGALHGGSALTAEIAAELRKPLLHIDLNSLSTDAAARRIADWLGHHRHATLNIAGPRASQDCRIYESALEVLMRSFDGRH